MRRTELLALALAVALAGAATGLPATGQAASRSVDAGIASAQDVSVDVTVRWDPKTPNRVRYVYSFDAAAHSEFALDVDERLGTVEGFTERPDGRLAYDPRADTHRVVVTQSVEESAEHHDWVFSADSGAMVGAPHVKLRWAGGGRAHAQNPLVRDYPNVDVSYGDHSGFRQWERIYVGAYTTYEADYEGQQYTFYRPALAPDEPYAAALRSMVATADRTPMTEAPARVDVVVFPDGMADDPRVHTYANSKWRGKAGGAAAGDGIVDSDAPVDHYDNTWSHEYVHLAQGYRDGPETRWFGEAQAEYLAATTMHAAGCGDGDLDAFLAAGDATRDDVLADGATWRTSTPYEKGPAVLAAFAARLHEQTNGRTTLTDVFAGMEDAHLADHAAFVEQVNRTVDDDALDAGNARFLDRYLTTGAYPADVDHPPMDRSDSCLGDYQHVAVETTTHRGGTATTATPTPTPAPSADAGPTAAGTAGPADDRTPTPAIAPDRGGVPGGWLGYVTRWVEDCRTGGTVACGL